MPKKILKTKRLILRGVGDKKSDLNDMIEGVNNLEVSKWLLSVPYPYKKSDALFWINYCKKGYKDKKGKSYEFALELKENKKYIGGFGLSKIDKFQGTATIGYWINSKYHGKGYGSEALNAIFNFAFNKLKLRRINAGVFVGNPSSGKLLEKFGAKNEGLKRKGGVCEADGKIKDDLIYGLLKEDFKPLK